jgi:hypothetical protein
MQTTRDAEYVADARKLEVDDSPIGHEEIEALLRRAKETPESTIQAFRKLTSVH